MSNPNANLVIGLSAKAGGDLYDYHEKARLASPPLPPPPSLCGIPLKYLSCVDQLECMQISLTTVLPLPD
jgi:hypothetical protein